jgi:hypothetical protein
MSRMPGKIETLRALPPVKLRIASRSRVVILFRCESAGEPLGEEGPPCHPPLSPSFLSSSGVAAQTEPFASFIRAAPRTAVKAVELPGPRQTNTGRDVEPRYKS